MSAKEEPILTDYSQMVQNLADDYAALPVDRPEWLMKDIIQNFCIESNKLLTSRDYFTLVTNERESYMLDGEWLKYRLYDYACGFCQIGSFVDHGVYGIFAPRYSFIELADMFAAEEQNVNEI